LVVIAGDRPFARFELAPDIWPEHGMASRRPIGGGPRQSLETAWISVVPPLLPLLATSRPDEFFQPKLLFFNNFKNSAIG
jgi:hypothetical protein